MHTGGEGKGGKIFKKLVDKNAIKPKVGDLSGNFVLKALTPVDKSELPHPLDFQPMCIYLCSVYTF
jgi:hypothetical protein